MRKIKISLIIFTLVLVVSFILVEKVDARIINTLNISIQNPPLAPNPPKKPEPPLPPNIPTSTPTPGPTQSPGSNSDSDVCPNLNGIQTGVPDGYHKDTSSGACNQFQYGGAPQVGNGTDGQVLGASTMAGTGSFTESLYLAIMGLGAIITASGAKNFKKTN